MSVLITGAAGQIGSELAPTLRHRDTRDTVIATDVVARPDDLTPPYETVDVTDPTDLETVIENYDVDTIYHLAAILSATGEENPQQAYHVNVDGLYNVLETSRTTAVEQVVIPSSIAVFGPATPANPGEETILAPTTMYGVSKVFGELLGTYYHSTYGLDVRGVRFPGLLSHETMPGGGTTDYAVEAFYEAITSGEYTYFVGEDTRLPMMYMPDAIRALVDLAEADGSDLHHRCNYNVSALTVTPAELTAEIRKHVPDFEARYEPDSRQAIAESWPDTLDDSAARADWDWTPEYGFETMVADMLQNLERRLAPQNA